MEYVVDKTFRRLKVAQKKAGKSTRFDFIVKRGEATLGNAEASAVD